MAEGGGVTLPAGATDCAWCGSTFVAPGDRCGECRGHHEEADHCCAVCGAKFTAAIVGPGAVRHCPRCGAELLEQLGE